MVAALGSLAQLLLLGINAFWRKKRVNFILKFKFYILNLGQSSEIFSFGQIELFCNCTVFLCIKIQDFRIKFIGEEKK